jgi:peptidoglycan/xylan/chitin deacetylase (PgdA/CDA1 family)
LKDSIPRTFCWPGNKRAAVSLTWDDARPSQVDVGVPILDRFGIKGTFYVLPRNMKARVSKWRRAAGNGHEIGNHSLNHPCTGNFDWQTRETMLESYTLARMEKELLEANRVLHVALGVEPTSYAYCCGQNFVGRGTHLRSYVPLVAKLFAVGQAGFSETYANPAICDLAQVPSIKFDNKAFGDLRETVDAAAADGSWLILMGHEVGDIRAKQTTSAGALRQLCSYLNRRPDIWVDTVTAVGRHVGATVRHPPSRARSR